MTEFAAKDIFRASTLSLLGVSNSHVEKDRATNLSTRKTFAPLAIQGRTQRQAVIADGYHRLCAVYTFDEDAIIPCKIV
jgi:hypothetical protein